MISLFNYCESVLNDTKATDWKVLVRDIQKNKKQLTTSLTSLIEEYCNRVGNKLKLTNRQSGIPLAILTNDLVTTAQTTIHISHIEFHSGSIYAVVDGESLGTSTDQPTYFNIGTAEDVINNNLNLGITIFRMLNRLLVRESTD